MQLTARLTAISHLNKTFLRNTCSQISACVLKFTPIEMPWLRTRKQQKNRTTKTKRVLSMQPMDRSRNSWRNKSFFLSEINCRPFVRTRDRVCDFAPRIFMKWLNKYNFLCPNFPYSKSHSFQQRNNSNNGMAFARTRQFANHFRNIWRLHRKHQPKVTKGCFLSVLS